MGVCPSKFEDVLPSSPSNQQQQVASHKNFDPGPLTLQEEDGEEDLGLSRSSEELFGNNPPPEKNEDSQKMVQDFLRGFQDKNFHRMKNDVRQDPNMFILDNLLMTIQFVPNFEEACDQAEKFRIAKELEMNTGLRQDDSIGPLRVSLLHGMGIEVAKNYLYQRQTAQKQTEPSTSASSLGLDDIHSTSATISEDILPLEFLVSFENFCVHTERQYDDLMHIEEGGGRVQSPAESQQQEHGGRDNCLCMQEDVDMKGDKIPTGYVRLYNEMSARHRKAVNLLQAHRGSTTSTDLSSCRRDSDRTQSTTSSSPTNRKRASSMTLSELDDPYIIKTFPVVTKPLESIQEISSSFSTRSIEFSPNNQRRQYSKKGDPHHDLPSSGYGTSQASTSTSASHAANAQMRAARRIRSHQMTFQQQIQKGPSLPSECFTEILIENDDQSQEEESDSDSHESSSKEEENFEKNETQFTKRRYLNPDNVSIHFQAEFDKISSAMGIQIPSLFSSDPGQIKLDGVTLSLCDEEFAIDCEENVGKKIKILQTFKPTIKTEQWPPKLILSFIQQTSSSTHQKNDLDYDWPGKNKIQTIAHDLGCNLIPLPPSPSGKLKNGENSKIPMEWKTDFCQGEKLLLNSLTHAQLRSYIFAALLFKTFVQSAAPIDGLGIGLEHLRNLFFQMWQANFVSWNDERGGHHLTKFLDKLYACLAKKEMTNYFIPKQNMLRHAGHPARKNVYRVQGLLSKVRENLTIHCMVALTCLRRQKNNSFPPFDLKTLYKLMTTPGGQGDIIFIINPTLKYSAGPPPSPSRSEDRKKLKKKSNNNNNPPNNELQKDHPPIIPPDEGLLRTRRKYQKWLQLEEKRRKAATAAQVPEAAKPKEKKKKKIEIDLDKLPVTHYTNLRMVTIIELFIHHFLKMAAQSLHHKAWAEGTMYVMHVQNLCRLLQQMELGGTRLDEMQILEFLREANQLTTQLGPKVLEYLRGKISHLRPAHDHEGPFSSIFLSKMTPITTNSYSGEENNNFYFSANSMSSFSSSFASSRRPPLMRRAAESLRNFPPPPPTAGQSLSAYERLERMAEPVVGGLDDDAHNGNGTHVDRTFGDDDLWTSQLGQKLPRVRRFPRPASSMGSGSQRQGISNKHFGLSHHHPSSVLY